MLLCTDAEAAIRWHGRADSDLDALIGRFGLAAALTQRPEADPAAPSGAPHALRHPATPGMSIPASSAPRITTR